MMSLSFLLQIVALICLICASLSVNPPRVGLGWMGMAVWLLSLMVSGVILR